MKTAVQRRDPETQCGIPVWCHHHCTKMRAVELNRGVNRFVIAGSAARVQITRRATTAEDGWFVDWEVVQSQQEKVNGRIIFSSNELRAAFGLSEDSGRFGDWFIEQFGADSAEQGKYIRWKTFLNIPGPGTGHDGDPNVSIRLNEEIQNTVRQLLI